MLLKEIKVPDGLGHLVPADEKFNGPSGNTLDHSILRPLNLTRADAWLGDLVPHSCVNAAQLKAIQRAYAPLTHKHGLPAPDVPPVPKELANDARRRDFLAELEESRADTLILLSDQPIQWFLAHFDSRWQRLRDFQRDGQAHGALHRVLINNRELHVLPLAHPRQIARLGQTSPVWFELHQAWLDSGAGQISL